MKCENNCPYFWADTDEQGNPISRAYCHYQYDDGYAPCEEDDYETEDYDEE